MCFFNHSCSIISWLLNSTTLYPLSGITQLFSTSCVHCNSQVSAIWDLELPKLESNQHSKINIKAIQHLDHLHWCSICKRWERIYSAVSPLLPISLYVHSSQLHTANRFVSLYFAYCYSSYCKERSSFICTYSCISFGPENWSENWTDSILSA